MDTTYSRNYYENLKEASKKSATEIVPLVLELIDPKSVVDIGCGTGAWLSVFEEFGIEDYLGIDHDIDENLLEIPPEKFLSFDLKNPLVLDREFDLLVSLEVAEHLPQECAEPFVKSLISCGSAVLFSAAIPFQGGVNHINEQWPQYWASYFDKYGYKTIDCLRKKIWSNEKVEPWYAQNILIFIKREKINDYPSLKKIKYNCSFEKLSLVHPKLLTQCYNALTPEVQLLSTESTHTVRVEMTEPIPDIFTFSSAKILLCLIEYDKRPIAIIELPIFDGLVTSYVLSDAIVSDYAWQILGYFFQKTIYEDIKLEYKPNGLLVKRGKVTLLEGSSIDASNFRQKTHELIGWNIFLQEIWGRPDWPMSNFYNYETVEGISPCQIVKERWYTVEVSKEVPDLQAYSDELNVLFTVGGDPINALNFKINNNILKAREIIAKLTTETGYELCRAAVREGLLGRPIDKKISLRNRLLEANRVKTQYLGNSNLPKSYNEIILAPGSDRAIMKALSPSKNGMLIARHAHGAIGTSTSRRAILPITTIKELLKLATIEGEPILQIPNSNQFPTRVIYAPELIWKSNLTQNHSLDKNDQLRNNINQQGYIRDHLERLFAETQDPFKFESQHQCGKYDFILSILPPKEFNHALELGCAEGHFTIKLAPYVNNLLAIDISKIALDRATNRCRNHRNVRFKRFDTNFTYHLDHYDLIACSDLFYFLSSQENFYNAFLKIDSLLKPGGYLLIAHSYLFQDESNQIESGLYFPLNKFDINEIVSIKRSFNLIREIQTPSHLIKLFQLRRRRFNPFSFKNQEIKRIEKSRELSKREEFPRFEYMLKKNTTSKNLYSDFVTILMYHGVYPSSTLNSSYNQVTPESFNEQLSYLYETGYYNITLDDWRKAKDKSKPLPGKPLIISFDDVHQDFMIYAWPILSQYRYSCMLFLTANEIGWINNWRRSNVKRLRPLNWEEIIRLSKNGVDFGSFLGGHRPLCDLSFEDIVRECSQSKYLIESKLKKPVGSFAYYHGYDDRIIQHLIGACGYLYGFSRRQGLNKFDASLLSLTRIEIKGSDCFEDFIKKLT